MQAFAEGLFLIPNKISQIFSTGIENQYLLFLLGIFTSIFFVIGVIGYISHIFELMKKYTKAEKRKKKE